MKTKNLFKTLTAFVFVAMLTVIPVTSAYAATVVKPAITWDSPSLCRVVNVSSGSTLTVRSGPGTSYSKLGSLYAYDSAVCDGQNSSGTWYHLQNDAGWVSASYMQRLYY